MVDLCENCLKPLKHWGSTEFCSEQCEDYYKQDQTRIERVKIKEWRIKTAKELIKKNLTIEEIAKEFRVPVNYLIELLR